MNTHDSWFISKTWLFNRQQQTQDKSVVLDWTQNGSSVTAPV